LFPASLEADFEGNGAMKRNIAIGLWLAVILLLLATPAGAAPWRGINPAQVAQRFIDDAGALADDCSGYIANLGDEGISAIGPLLEAGKVKQAERTANRYLRQIKQAERRGIAGINMGERMCVMLLNRVGATDWVAQVQQAADDAIATIRTSSENAVAAIQGLLADGGSGGVEIPPE
jgi:hypothetical protein